MRFSRFAAIFTLLLPPLLVESGKILMLFPMFSPSHYILGGALGRGLAEAGHEITMICPYPEKNQPKGWRHIVLEGFAEKGSRKFENRCLKYGKMTAFMQKDHREA